MYRLSSGVLRLMTNGQTLVWSHVPVWNGDVFSVKSFVEIVVSAMKKVGTWIIEGANVASGQLQVTVASMTDQNTTFGYSVVQRSFLKAFQVNPEAFLKHF